MSNNWQRLMVPYFSDCCEMVLTPSLTREGFSKITKLDWGFVRYSKDDCFLEISYFLEDSPNYRPVVKIGFGDSPYSESGELRSIGLWYAIPETSSAKGYSAWSFKSEQELYQVLKRLLDEVLMVFGKPLWANMALLETWVMKASKEEADSYQRSVMQDRLEAARSAFKNADYLLAVSLYEEFARSQLTLLDLKQLEIARRKF